MSNKASNKPTYKNAPLGRGSFKDTLFLYYHTTNNLVGKIQYKALNKKRLKSRNTKKNMNEKNTLLKWSNALDAFYKKDYRTCLEYFQSIDKPMSKVLYNIAIIYIHLKQLQDAREALNRSIVCDPYLSCAYFQRGWVYSLLGNYQEACKDFQWAAKGLRANTFIKYHQIGLKYQLNLYSIFYNYGLGSCYLERQDAVLKNFKRAFRVAVTSQERLDATRGMDLGLEACQYLEFIFIPLDILFTPSEGFMTNLDPINHLGSSQVVAIAHDANEYMGFDTLTRTSKAKQQDEQGLEQKEDELDDILDIYSSNHSESSTQDKDQSNPVPLIIRKRSTSIGQIHSPYRQRSNSSNSLFKLQSGIQLNIIYKNSPIASIPIKLPESLTDLIRIITSHIPSQESITLRYKDDQGTLIRLLDQEDLQTALATKQLLENSDWDIYVE